MVQVREEFLKLCLLLFFYTYMEFPDLSQKGSNHNANNMEAIIMKQKTIGLVQPCWLQLAAHGFGLTFFGAPSDFLLEYLLLCMCLRLQPLCCHHHGMAKEKGFIVDRTARGICQSPEERKEQTSMANRLVLSRAICKRREESRAQRIEKLVRESGVEHSKHIVELQGYKEKEQLQGGES